MGNTGSHELNRSNGESPMATIARYNTNNDLKGVDNWKYTTTNNIKVLKSRDEAKTYISGMCKIWKLESFHDGAKFSKENIKAIDNLHDSITNSFEFIDEKGDLCCILVLIQFGTDRKSIQITNTNHKLTRTAVRTRQADIQPADERSALQWLKERAYEEIHQRLPEVDNNMPIDDCMVERKPNRIDFQDNRLQQEDVTIIMGVIKSSPTLANERYCVLQKNMTKNGLTLYDIRDIAEFCKHTNDTEGALEQIRQHIMATKVPVEIIAWIFYQGGASYSLTIVAIPQDDLIHVCSNGIHVRLTPMRKENIKAIDNLHDSITNSFEFTDDKGDACCILVLIQLGIDGKSIQISNTNHKLTRKAVHTRQADVHAADERSALQWLKERAYEEIHQRLPEVDNNMPVDDCMVERKPNRVDFQETRVPNEDVMTIMGVIKSSPTLANERYCVLQKNVTRSGLALHDLKDIAEFCKHTNDREDALEQIRQRIMSAKFAMEIVAWVSYQGGASYSITIVAIPQDDLVHVCSNGIHVRLTPMR
ncbi:unnamed protein product, partial [Rotaria socialis]